MKRNLLCMILTIAVATTLIGCSRNTSTTGAGTKADPNAEMKKAPGMSGPPPPPKDAPTK
jgi:hypothetical protein